MGPPTTLSVSKLSAYTSPEAEALPPRGTLLASSTMLPLPPARPPAREDGAALSLEYSSTIELEREPARGAARSTDWLGTSSTTDEEA